jgi:hypothetical protein
VRHPLGDPVVEGRFVAAAGDHRRQRRGAGSRPEVGQQIQARRVGPLDVLNQQHQLGVPRHLAQELTHRGEQPPPLATDHIAVRSGTGELRQQPAELETQVVRQPVQRSVQDPALAELAQLP